MKISISGVVLIISNLIPIIGVVYLDWNLFLILFLYWLENLIIGFFNILKIKNAKGSTVVNKDIDSIVKPALISFFIMHYGMFTFVHGVFVLVLFKPSIDMGILNILIAFIFLIISHWVSYKVNYFGRGENIKNSPAVFFVQPYKRVIVMHVTIVLGASFILTFSQSLMPLIIMILCKTLIDVSSHQKEHKNLMFR